MGSPPDDDESLLIAAARAGDADAFGRLVRRHEGRVAAIVGRLLSDRRDAEEALQDTFVSAWRALGGFDGRARFTTWLHRIAVNEALMRLRRPRREGAELDRRTPDPGPGPDERAQSAALARFLVARLRALPEDQCVALVLRDVAGLSNREVAQALGISLPAAKSRVHRARLWLMEEVGAWEESGH